MDAFSPMRKARDGNQPEDDKALVKGARLTQQIMLDNARTQH